ncbi:MAG: SCO family protein [Actinomycetes bacterium]
MGGLTTLDGIMGRADLSSPLGRLVLLTSLVVLGIGLIGLVGWVLGWLSPGGHAWVARTATRLTGGSAPEPRSRRVLRLGLGGLWLLDGVLQAQPAMPSGFVPQVVAPMLPGQPGWLLALVDPLVRLWLEHPVLVDGITVWLQIGLGLVILSARRGGVLRAALVASVGWGLVVWAAGELLGGLAMPGASWYAGAPGSVLYYLAIAVLLLVVREAVWEDRAMRGHLRRGVGVVLITAGIVQAWPWEGFWTGSAVSDLFANLAQTPQPRALSAPMLALSRMGAGHPVLLNAVLVVLAVGIGLLLVRAGRPRWARIASVAGIVLALGSWWLVQDFGVLGGVGTDPNSAVVVALILMAGWPLASSAGQPAAAAEPRHRRSALGTLAGRSGRVATALSGVSALVLVPVLLGVIAVSPVSAQAAVADSGGLTPLGGGPAPSFTLLDQHGQVRSLDQWRGKVVLLTFLDPECYAECPIIAQQLAIADRALGPALAARTELVAVAANPDFHSVADVATFTTEHGLAHQANWQYLAGTLPALQQVWHSYGVDVSAPAGGMMVIHTMGVFVISPAGRLVGFVDDTANTHLTASYAALIASSVRAAQ